MERFMIDEKKEIENVEESMEKDEVISVPREPVRKALPQVNAAKPLAMVPDGPELPEDLAQFIASSWVNTMASLKEVGGWDGEIPRSFKVKVGADGSLLLKAVILPKDVIVVGEAKYGNYSSARSPVANFGHGVQGGRSDEYEAEGGYEVEDEDAPRRRTLALSDDGEVEVFGK